MTAQEPRLQLWSDDQDEARQTDEPHAEALIDDQAKCTDDLISRCNVIERRVHPAQIADALAEHGHMPPRDVLTNTRLFYYQTHMALLRAARAVLGTHFSATHDPGAPTNRFAYEAEIARAGVETNLEDIDNLLDELTQLEALVCSVREACREIIVEPPELSDVYVDEVC